MSISKANMVLLPYATPHPRMGTKWSSFHPMAVPDFENSKTEWDDLRGWSGYSSVYLASEIASQVMITIPSVSTPAGFTLSDVIKRFVNPRNIVADVFTHESRSDDHGSSIVEQIHEAFRLNSDVCNLAVVMPYQFFNFKDHKAGEPITGLDADFWYTHKHLRNARESIPECIGVAPMVDDNDQGEIEARDAKLFATLDDTLKGPYSRNLSVFVLSRSDFDELVRNGSGILPELETVVKKALAGKRGLGIPISSYSFILA
jgi:hypothetical protein